MAVKGKREGETCPWDSKDPEEKDTGKTNVEAWKTFNVKQRERYKKRMRRGKRGKKGLALT